MLICLSYSKRKVNHLSYKIKFFELNFLDIFFWEGVSECLENYLWCTNFKIPFILRDTKILQQMRHHIQFRRVLKNFLVFAEQYLDTISSHWNLVKTKDRLGLKKWPRIPAYQYFNPFKLFFSCGKKTNWSEFTRYIDWPTRIFPIVSPCLSISC